MCATISGVEVERVEQSLWGVFADVQRSTCCASPMSRYEKYGGSFESWSWPQAVVLVRITTDTGHSGIGWAEDGVGAASNINRTAFHSILDRDRRGKNRAVMGPDVSRLNSLRAQGSRN